MTGLDAPRGLIVDLVTPLEKTGDIDTGSLHRLLNRVIPYCQAVLLASPQAGEGSFLNPAQIKKLLEASLSIIGGKIKVFFWMSRKSEDETRENLLELARTVGKRGTRANVFWVDTPLSYRSNRGLPAYYRELTSKARALFILSNDPEFVQKSKGEKQPLKRSNIRTGILKELASIQEIKGMIFRGPLGRAHNYQKAVRTRPEFRIYDGDEAHFLNYPSLSGVISPGASLAPKPWQRITASSMSLEDPDYRYPDQVRQILDAGAFVSELRGFYQHHPAPVLKEALCRLGVIACNASWEKLEVPPEHIDRLVEVVKRQDEY
ncbi:MAG: dihydrodipicolinate synthase family protein [Deltaproteobacteria bacterium]|nr:dihydrodipicolinate synthase family protein [Deltaproteobacteria bacterium]